MGRAAVAELRATQHIAGAELGAKDIDQTRERPRADLMVALGSALHGQWF